MSSGNDSDVESVNSIDELVGSIRKQLQGGASTGEAASSAPTATRQYLAEMLSDSSEPLEDQSELNQHVLNPGHGRSSGSGGRNGAIEETNKFRSVGASSRAMQAGYAPNQTGEYVLSSNTSQDASGSDSDASVLFGTAADRLYSGRAGGGIRLADGTNEIQHYSQTEISDERSLAVKQRASSPSGSLTRDGHSGAQQRKRLTNKHRSSRLSGRDRGKQGKRETSLRAGVGMNAPTRQKQQRRRGFKRSDPNQGALPGGRGGSTATLPFGLVPQGAAPSDPRIHAAMMSRTDLAQSCDQLAAGISRAVARRQRAVHGQQRAAAERVSMRSEHSEASRLLVAKGRIPVAVESGQLGSGADPRALGERSSRAILGPLWHQLQLLAARTLSRHASIEEAARCVVPWKTPSYPGVIYESGSASDRAAPRLALQSVALSLAASGARVETGVTSAQRATRTARRKRQEAHRRAGAAAFRLRSILDSGEASIATGDQGRETEAWNDLGDVRPLLSALGIQVQSRAELNGWSSGAAASTNDESDAGADEAAGLAPVWGGGGGVEGAAESTGGLSQSGSHAAAIPAGSLLVAAGDESNWLRVAQEEGVPVPVPVPEPAPASEAQTSEGRAGYAGADAAGNTGTRPGVDPRVDWLDRVSWLLPGMTSVEAAAAAAAATASTLGLGHGEQKEDADGEVSGGVTSDRGVDLTASEPGNDQDDGSWGAAHGGSTIDHSTRSGTDPARWARRVAEAQERLQRTKAKVRQHRDRLEELRSSIARAKGRCGV